MSKAIIRIGLLALLFSAISFNGSNLKAASYSENNLIFLCIGQSNMEGNARPEDQDMTGVNLTRFKKMYCADSDGSNKGKWATAYPPLCRQSTGLTPVDYFGRYLCDSLATKYKIYVIVVAVAGCSIKMFDKDQYQSYISEQETWMQNIANDYGGNPYGRLIALAKEAQKIGVIKGVLLHQGESDAYNDDWITNVKKVYNNILTDLDLKSGAVPMLVGEVVNADQNGVCAGANTTIAKLAKQNMTIHLISSAGCPAGPDNLHFSAEGYRMLGKRYGEKMFELLKKKGYDTKSAVESVNTDTPAMSYDSPIYNINGQQVIIPGNGINIINGHKYIFR